MRIQVCCGVCACVLTQRKGGVVARSLVWVIRSLPLLFPLPLRYDVGVLEHCGKDVDRLCADAKNRLHGNATVLKCLAENFAQTGAQAGRTEGSAQVVTAFAGLLPCAACVLLCGAQTALTSAQPLHQLHLRSMLVGRTLYLMGADPSV